MLETQIPVYELPAEILGLPLKIDLFRTKNKLYK